VTRALLIVLACAGTASADWVVVSGGADEATLESLREAFDARSADAALARLAGTLPADPPRELYTRLARTTERVLEHVAFGRNGRAITEGGPVLTEVERYLPVLGQDARASRDVANLCLFLVRAQLEGGGAGERARACLRLVPDLDPDEDLHPEPVRVLLQEVRALVDEDAAILAVEADAAAGCAVLVQGRDLGAPPVRRALPAGEVTVQIRCDLPGRVHRRVLEAGDATRLVLRPALEGALDSPPIAEHAATILRETGATRLLVALPDGCVAFERRAGTVQRLGRSAHDDAARFLEAGSRESSALRPVGWTFVSVAVASLATSVVLHRVRNSRGDSYASTLPADTTFLDRQSAWRALALPVPTLAAVAGLLGSVGAAVLAPPRRGWTWALGAAGLGLAAAALSVGLRLEGCEDDTVTREACADRARGTGRLALLTAAAAPLLTLAISSTARVDANPGGLTLRVTY